jgi:predicted SpoU family rRNA methylase
MNIEEIESAIAQLPHSEVAKLAKWFEEFLARVWDRQLEQDVEAGRLDALLEQAEKDFEQGRCEPL